MAFAASFMILTDAVFYIFKHHQAEVTQLFFPAAGIGTALLIMGFTSASLSESKPIEFHYNLMMQVPETDQVHYHSGDKIYINEAEFQATDLFLNAEFTENAYRSNRTKLTVAREAHFLYRPIGEMRFLERPGQGQTPHSFAHMIPENSNGFLYQYFAHHPYGRITAVNRSYPKVNPGTGEVIAEAGQPITQRKHFRFTGHHSLYLSDITAELTDLKSPGGPLPAELDFIYEYFFFDTGLNPEAYYGYFPHTLIGVVNTRIIPLLTLVWSAILFLMFILVFYLLTEIQSLIHFISNHFRPEEKS
jgi:hypothetical protein